MPGKSTSLQTCSPCHAPNLTAVLTARRFCGIQAQDVRLLGACHLTRKKNVSKAPSFATTRKGPKFQLLSCTLVLGNNWVEQKIERWYSRWGSWKGGWVKTQAASGNYTHITYLTLYIYYNIWVISLNGDTPISHPKMIIFLVGNPWLLGKPTILGNPHYTYNNYKGTHLVWFDRLISGIRTPRGRLGRLRTWVTCWRSV